MKNNKAFTLVELLAVVAILTLIIVMITPKVFKQLKTAENVTDQEQINSLINTSKIYMNQNSNLLPQENDIYVISLDELKESGLIQKSQILNPSTNEELNGYIIVKFENNKYKYEYKEKLEEITVTFDPQGGTLQETSKNVITGEKYGTLPTPTKEGYTFMGWNGKNMFELKETVDYKYSTTQYTVDIDNNSVMIGNDGGYEIIEYYLPELKANTKYTITGNTILTNINGGVVRITTIRNTTNITNEQFLLSRFDADGVFSYVFTVGNQDETTAAILLYGNRSSTPTLGAKVNYSNIMITEGNTATEYEPYYITPSTTVVQDKNHTLKAIWKANE